MVSPDCGIDSAVSGIPLKAEGCEEDPGAAEDSGPEEVVSFAEEADEVCEPGADAFCVQPARMPKHKTEDNSTAVNLRKNQSSPEA